MHPEIKIWLKDIELAISEIYQFLPPRRTYTAFQKDLKARKAIERNIEIIGEAVNRIKMTNPGIDISDARKIIDTRNRIIHGYDTVSSDVIWLIISKNLPLLEKEVKRLLEK